MDFTLNILDNHPGNPDELWAAQIIRNNTHIGTVASYQSANRLLVIFDNAIRFFEKDTEPHTQAEAMQIIEDIINERLEMMEEAMEVANHFRDRRDELGEELYAVTGNDFKAEMKIEEVNIFRNAATDHIEYMDMLANHYANSIAEPIDQLVDEAY